MGMDLGRIASSALEAALDDGEPQRKRGGALKAVAAGAALAVAAKAATSNRTKLMSKLVPATSLDGLRDRFHDLVDDGDEPDEGLVDDELVDEEDEEPVAEEDEDFDEEDEEDLDDEDEDFDEQPVDEEDEDFDDEDDDDEEFEDDDEESPPELEIESEDDEDLHPEDRPPQPPRSKATSER